MKAVVTALLALIVFPAVAAPAAKTNTKTAAKTRPAAVTAPAKPEAPSNGPAAPAAKQSPPLPAPPAPPAPVAAPVKIDGITTRLKDVAAVDWGAETPVFGYGLIIGLDGTGDSRQVAFTVQSIANMLSRLGVTVDASRLQVRNVAAVMVTASLPSYAEVGSHFDVTVSALGDAQSIHGGVLLQTPLQAADGRLYAMAQGPVSIGGFNISSGGSSVQKNHPTTGRVVNGGVALLQPDGGGTAYANHFEVRLTSPDATSAARIATAINENCGPGVAAVLSPAAVAVQVPAAFADRVPDFVSRLEQLTVQPDAAAKVVVNERTGTVVMGGHVRVMPVVIAHGSLRVEIAPEVAVVQPPPLSSGSTVVVPTTNVQAQEDQAQVAALAPGNTIEDLVKVLQGLQITPRDLIAILQALKQSGALLADLEIQ